MKEKQCSSCKETLLIKYFSFRSDTNKYRGQCKKCHKGYVLDREDFYKERDELLKEGKKKCGFCNDVKILELFNSDKHTKTGYSSRCKECINHLNSLKDKKEVKINRIKNLYSIEFEDALSITSISNCEICGIHFDGLLSLNVDHCHNTGKVRGALCGKCNRAIGLFGDNIDTLKSAIKYLKRG